MVKKSVMNEKMPVLLVMALTLSSLSFTSAFVPSTGMIKPTIHTSLTKTISLQGIPSSSKRFMSSVDEDSSYLSSFFTGGAFESKEAKVLNDKDAIAIASKIKSVKDLGWSKPPKRKGNKRPRHRAWGGQDEVPVQDKPAYDESNKNSPEKWLSQEEFESKTRCKSGPASDTVFVAFAGGGTYAERYVVEELLAQWRSPDGKKFNEAAFLASVKKGRTDLAIGWALFLFLSIGSASCIVFPTNPLSKGLEHLLDVILS